jgi:hypothetical protein
VSASSEVPHEVPESSVVIDRFVEGSAVLHVGPAAFEIIVPRAMLPSGVKEGDWLTLRFERDDARTVARREALMRRVERIRRERSGGRFG